MATLIKAVIFDQGGVLSLGGEKGTNEKAATRAIGLRETIVVPKLLDDLKRGRIDNNIFVQEVNRLYPDAPNVLTDKMWDDVYLSLKPERVAYDFAGKCHAAGLHVGLLSNINPAIAARLHKDGSYKGFDPLILSCEVGCAKPDPEIYAKVEQALPAIRPGEILLLDDQDKCVQGAVNRGWQALKVTSTKQLVRDASKLLGFL
ncbi:MAG TPA: HAD family hydrolase [Verrucomicrobiae bacterium]|nr:HAD family hydrolase [Verrucomicrobiae bacterium]